MLRYQLSLRKPVGKKYLVMNLGQGESGWQEYDKTKPITIEYFDDAPSGGFNTATYRKFKIAFRRCRAGTYWMGSPETEDGRGENEKRHLVTLTNDFYLAILPLTGSHAWCLASQGGDHAWYGWENTFCHLSPIVTYRGLSTDAKWSSDSSVSETSFIGKIRNRMPTTGIGLPAGYVIDLPTEAQWEYACRAGTTSAFNNGEEPDYYDVYDVSGTYYPSATPVPGYKSCHTLDKLGRYCGNGGVWQQNKAPENQFGGKFAANAWGFYDMHGLYSEICLDTYVQDLGAEHQIEPSNRGTSGLQVVRGGGWLTSASSCRSACRSSYDLQWSHSNAYGVRLAIVPGNLD